MPPLSEERSDEGRLTELLEVIRNLTTSSDQTLIVLQQIVDAVIAHGDAKVLQEVQTIIARHSAACAALAGTSNAKVH